MNAERNETFDEFLDEILPEYKIGEMTFSPSSILYHCDPIAYRCELSNWESEQEGTE